MQAPNCKALMSKRRLGHWLSSIHSTQGEEKILACLPHLYYAFFYLRSSTTNRFYALSNSSQGWGAQLEATLALIALSGARRRNRDAQLGPWVAQSRADQRRMCGQAAWTAKHRPGCKATRRAPISLHYPFAKQSARGAALFFARS